MRFRCIKLISAVFLFLVCLSSQSMRPDVEQKITDDLALFDSFNVTSLEIENRDEGDFVTIGGDGACDFFAAFSTIQEVIDTGITEIRVASNGLYEENIVVNNQSIIIRGGFDTCVEANLNQQTTNSLVFINAESTSEPVIKITGSDDRHLVRLENLWLEEGGTVGIDFGGGLSLDNASLELQLMRFNTTENSSSLGAGIGIDAGSSSTDVFGRDVIVGFNQSSNVGGGIYCVGNSNVVLTGMSQVTSNQAETRGAGMFLFNGCEVSMYTEKFEESIFPRAGIFNNFSEGNGGGVFMTLGAKLFLFGQKMCIKNACLGSNRDPIYVRQNSALNEAMGGGFYIEGNANHTSVVANGLYMDQNKSASDGGGVYIKGNGSFTVQREEGGCWSNDTCNLITENQSGTSVGSGGAFYVDDGSLEVSQSILSFNRADIGTAIAVNGENAQVTLESVIMHDNGLNGADGFSDFQVIQASLGASVFVRYSTFALNRAINSVFNIDPALNSSLTMSSSIVYDSTSGNVLGPVSGPVTVNCAVVHEDSSFNGNQIIVSDPLFKSLQRRDFHLSSLSPAIDMCQGIPTVLTNKDIDSEPRGWDDPDIVNGSGPFDAGADESYINDVIFEDDFDPTNT